MYAYYSLESNSVVLCIVSMRNNTVRRARNLHDVHACMYVLLLVCLFFGVLSRTTLGVANLHSS